jgi:hypothetical protein
MAVPRPRPPLELEVLRRIAAALERIAQQLEGEKK